jgi:hypothetical protein
MRILNACEKSGAVRRALRALGHDAWSCDVLPAEDDSPYHIQGDALDHLWDGWDMMIAHPPCTRLAVSGARWFKDYEREQHAALHFAWLLMCAPIERKAIENPVSILSTRIRKPDQIVHPWWFGHPETKATCWWLEGLPKLVPTDDVRAQMALLPAKERNRVHYASPGPARGEERSRTLPGCASAYARQWAGHAHPWQEAA